MAPPAKEVDATGKDTKDKESKVDAKEEESKVEKQVEVTTDQRAFWYHMGSEMADCVEILQDISLIGRAVATIEPRLTIRVLKTLTSTRKKLDKEVLRTVLERAFPAGCTSH